MNFTKIIESYKIDGATITLYIKFHLQSLIETKLLESEEFYNEFDAYMKSISGDAPISYINLLNAPG